MRKIGFAVFFIVAVLGAVLLLISQIPLRTEGYDVVDTRSFSDGEPLTFYWTFEPNVRYRFEVKGADWTNPPHYAHLFSVGNSTHSTYLYDVEGVVVQNPWSGNYSDAVTAVTHARMLNATFWHHGNETQEIDKAFTPTLVEVSAFKATTYQLTYLIYVGLPLLIIGAILITITGKDVNSQMGKPDMIAR